jgi:hypothetical protein
LLLISHVAARGQAETIGEEALVDASAVVGRARIERLHVHRFPQRAGLDLVFQQLQADVFTRDAGFGRVDGQLRAV